jgi:hypothetical protein
MSNQRPQQFNTTPSFTTPEASAAPTIRTQGFQATAAVQQSNTSGINAIGNALGSFFGGAAKAVDSVEETMHKQELVQVDRENTALAQQGHIDLAPEKWTPRSLLI